MSITFDCIRPQQNGEQGRRPLRMYKSPIIRIVTCTREEPAEKCLLVASEEVSRKHWAES